MNLEKYNSYPEYIEKLHSYNEELFWTNCKQHNSIQMYKNYLEMFPNGKYRNEAIRKAWEITRKLNTTKGYEDFLKFFPNSPYEKEARKQIKKDEKAWEIAVNINSMDSYRIYLNQFPNGKYANRAYEKAFETARQLNTLKAYKEFLDLFPNAPTVYKTIAISKAWEITRKLNTTKGYADFLRYFPNSPYEKEAREQIKKKIESVKANTFTNSKINSKDSYKQVSTPKRKKDKSKFGAIEYLFLFLVLLLTTISAIYWLKNSSNNFPIGYFLELGLILALAFGFSFINDKLELYKEFPKLDELISSTLCLAFLSYTTVFFTFMLYNACKRKDLFGIILSLILLLPSLYLFLYFFLISLGEILDEIRGK